MYATFIGVGMGVFVVVVVVVTITTAAGDIKFYGHTFAYNLWNTNRSA